MPILLMSEYQNVRMSERGTPLAVNYNDYSLSRCWLCQIGIPIERKRASGFGSSDFGRSDFAL